METLRERVRTLEQRTAFEAGKKVNAPADVDPAVVLALVARLDRLEGLVSGLLRNAYATGGTVTATEEKKPGAGYV